MDKNTSFLIYKDNNLKNYLDNYNFQILEEYWNIRKKECEKNLSKFC